MDLTERRPPLRAGEHPVTDEDAEAGGWLDAAARVHGIDALAELLGVDLQYLLKMRKGQKPIAGRHLVRMKGQTEAVLALTADLLESIGHVARPVNAPTFVQLAGAVLADLDDGSSVTRRMIENAARKRGWSQEQVAMALRREDEK